MQEHYDVAIVGGGVVGLTLAALLANAEMRVVVFERQEIPDFNANAPYATRVSAITLGSEMIFRHLGLWSLLCDQRVSTFQKMFVWESKEESSIHFDSATLPANHLGHIIENHLLQSLLYQFCQNHPQITLLTKHELVDVTIHSERVDLIDSFGKTWHSRLVVGADGVNSWLREKLAFPLKKHDYHHHALVATVTCERSHLKTAWQCFLPDGPLAFLPLSDEHSCSIVWSSLPTHIERLMQLDEKQFNHELEQTYLERLGKIQLVSQRKTFPLHKMHSQYYVKPRVALIGDAAHNIHPLAGQGMNCGLWDAAVLAEVIIDKYQHHRDFGLESYLRQYQRRRQHDNRMMLAAVDGFKWLFTHDQPIVQHFRHIGLKMTHRVLPLKHWFMRRAMGLVGDLPKVMVYSSGQK